MNDDPPIVSRSTLEVSCLAGIVVVGLIACGAASPAGGGSTQGADVRSLSSNGNGGSGPPPPTADSCGDAQTCASVGLELGKRGDNDSAVVALEKACALRHVDACAALAVLLPQRKDVNAHHAALVAHKGCELEGASGETRRARGAACRAWGEALQRDSTAGIEPAFIAFDDACKLGDTPSCITAQKLDERRTFEADVKQQLGQPSSRQQVLKNGVASWVACRTEATGPKDPLDMFADQTLLTDREAALEACALQGGPAVRLVWTADASHKVTMVKVLSGDAALGTCIKQALLDRPARRVETCVASAHLGR